MSIAVTRTCAALAAAALLGGCAMSNFGLPWVPQGPGISPDEARNTRQGQAAPARPATAAAAPAATAAPVSTGTGAATPAPMPATGWGAPPAGATAAPAAAPAPAARAAPSAAPAPVVAAAAALPAASPDALRPGGGYPQSSRYGDMVFVSGQIAMDLRSRNVAADASVEEQVRMTLDNVRTVLEASGLNLANVVSTTVYLKNINDLPAVDAAYARAFKGTMPSRSVVEVSRLPRGVAVEISAVAGR